MTGLKKWKPLLCSPSPRDIKEVYEAHRKLPYDKLYAKYLIEGEAYHHLRKFFLNSEEYTHMILIPDDLVVTPEDMKKLWKDLQKYDYPILSGICNVNTTTHKDYWSITENLPHPVRTMAKRDDNTIERWIGYRWYSWFNDDTISDEQKRQKRKIIRVPHSGFALQCLRRDVVERLNFITDAEANGITTAHCSSIDVMFSNSCAIDGIAIMVDPDIRMKHLRDGGQVLITLGDPEMWHVVGDERKTYKIQSSVPRKVTIINSEDNKFQVTI